MCGWAILFSLVCLFRGSFTSEGAKETEDTASSGSVPGLNAVYWVNRLFPGRSEIACVVEDSQDVLHTHLVPPHLRNPIFRTHLVPEYLSYTISAGEDLRARLRGAKSRGEVWWQQEPIRAGGWRQTTLTEDGELVIPAALLSGSGFYSFVDEDNVDDTSILGTLSLVVRECPAHRYGDDCRGWCPDCMHGGVCHPRTGQCVCHEGTMGSRCETRCERGMAGRHCSVRSLTLPGGQVCQPSPAPCRCVPGYTGPRCNITCSAERWGPNCEQDCTHHCVGDCDSETGMCGGQGPSPCAGGNAGLPRLRQAPEVRDIGADQATVVFSEWREGYDDGNATLWDTFIYVVRLAGNTANKTAVDTIATGSRHSLTNLTSLTTYRVMVMVMVARQDLTCMADGRGRERVHSVSFTTTCPEEIPAPVIVQTEKTSDTSVFVKWKPVPRPRGCGVEYLLSVIPEASSETSTPLDIQNITLTETHREVEELKANVAYTIHVLAKSTTSFSASAYSSTRLKIHGRSVGLAKTVWVVATVLLVAVLVVVVLMWRRRRRPHSSVSVSNPPFEVSASSPPPPPPTEILLYRMVEIDGEEEGKDEGGGGEGGGGRGVEEEEKKTMSVLLKEKDLEGEGPTGDNGSSVSKKILIGTAVGGLVGVGVVVGAPLALAAAGFTSMGIAAGSFGASMMSSAAVANGGMIAAGSTVAVLQSAGAVGIPLAANAAIAGGAAAAGLGIGAGAAALGAKGKKDGQ